MYIFAYRFTNKVKQNFTKMNTKTSNTLKDAALAVVFLASLAAASATNGLLCFVYYTPGVLAAFRLFRRHGLIY